MDLSTTMCHKHLFLSYSLCCYSIASRFFNFIEKWKILKSRWNKSQHSQWTVDCSHTHTHTQQQQQQWKKVIWKVFRNKNYRDIGTFVAFPHWCGNAIFCRRKKTIFFTSIASSVERINIITSSICLECTSIINPSTKWTWKIF